MDDNLRREIILDNYKDPYNRGLVNDDSYIKTNSRSESCIDNLDFMLKINNGTIEDIRFDGEACAISTSAASIMLRKLVGKSVDEESLRGRVCYGGLDLSSTTDLTSFALISAAGRRR